MLCLLGAAALPVQAAPARADKPAPSAALDRCSWDRPGANPFTGDVVAAVDRYTDIPLAVRSALKARMAQRAYDEIAVIGRDSISGKHRYSAEIRDMHFGQGQVCASVTRSRWPAAAQERGLVYCESGHCVIVPTVCRNVSRVTRLQAAASAGGPGAAPSGGTETVAAAGPAAETAKAPSESNELLFEAPSAGLSGGSSSPLPTLVELPAYALGLGVPRQPGEAAPLAQPAGSFDNASGAAAGPATVWPGAASLASAVPWPTGVGLGSAPAVIVVAPTPAVPEPASTVMMLLGLAALAAVRRRQRSPKTKD